VTDVDARRPNGKMDRPQSAAASANGVSRRN